jgi:hypothetical protein
MLNIIQQLLLIIALLYKGFVIYACNLDILGDRLRETLGLFLPSAVVLISWLLDGGEALEGLHKIDAALQAMFLARALMFLAKSGQLLNVFRIYDQLAINF